MLINPSIKSGDASVFEVLHQPRTYSVYRFE
jgi:hypothetical protein